MRYIASITPENNTLVVDVTTLFGVSAGTKYVEAVITIDTDGEFIDYVTDSYDDDGTLLTAGCFYVNGVRITNYSPRYRMMKNYASPYMFNFRIEPDEVRFRTGKITIQFSEDGRSVSDDDYITLYISDADVQHLEAYNNEEMNTHGRLNSFMLMRTNPKLTGNIKIVVDSEERIYMDTFKASSVLNNRIYRKYPISSEGNYPHDVMTVFSNLPVGELYKTPTESLDPHKFYKEQSKQYVTDYEYGAETNLDDLYPENMKILAPLHIGKNVPDFFCVFRFDEIYNTETYHSTDIDDLTKFTKMLKESAVVKIFDLRSYTAAGQYIRNYAKMINNIIHGSCYLQFIEQDNDRDSGNYRQGNNSWKGIDIARGIITNKIESSYFANNILVSEDAVQERFNNYIINGYERNNVLYPYVLNMEFMFNDEASEEFSMHRYFGLYLTANEFRDYQCIITDYNNGNGVVRKLDNDDNDINDTELFGSVFQDKFCDRIMFMTTNNAAMRVESETDVKNFINDNVLDNPDGNIADVRAEEVLWKDDHKSFITLSFSEPVKYGEHLRFVGFNVYNEDKKIFENICLEIIASNDERLLETDDFIFPYISTNNPDVFVHGDDADGSLTQIATSNIYRLTFYTQDTTDSTKLASVSEQIERICACIRKFNSFVRVTAKSEDSIGIVSTEEDVYFQHIAAVNKNDEPTLQKLYVTEEYDSVEHDYKTYINYSAKESITKTDYESYIKSLYDEMKKDGRNVGVRYEDDAYELDDKFYTKKSVGVVTNFVEYENPENTIVDTIHYFSRVHDTVMRPISPDTHHYDRTFGVFSLFGFESLGWRYSNIIKFKRPTDFKHPFVVYDNLQEILKYVRHPLVKISDKKFESMLLCNIDNDYLTDNVLLNLDYDKLHIHTQKIVTHQIERHTILSPYNLNGCIIDFYERPFLHNYTLAIFNVESAQLCAMGILGIKDIDMSIDLTHDNIVENEQSIDIPAGTVIDISSNEDNYVYKDILYEVVNGSFKEINLKRFIIYGTDLYYTQDDSENGGATVNEASFFGSVLTVSADMTLKMLDAGNHQEFSYKNSEPMQSDDNFFTYRDEKATSGLDIPVVPMTNCFWESNGLYLDGTSVLNVDDIVDYTDNDTYLSKNKGYFTEHSQSPAADTTKNMYINNSTSSYILMDGELLKFKDTIVDGSVKNAIKKMIYRGSVVDTAIGYYNSYIQSLEFIYYGIKFSLKFDAEYYNQSLRIGEYNNFDVYFINDYNSILDNELYISADEEFILFVNHKFNLTPDFSKYTKIHKIDGDISESVDYAVIDAPYNVRTDTICGFSDTLVVGKTNSESMLKNAVDTYFIQEDYADKEFAENSKIPSHYLYMPVTNDSANVFNVKQKTVGIMRKDNSDNELIDKFDNNEYLDDASDTVAHQGRNSNSFLLCYMKDAETDSRSMTAKVKEYMKSIEGNLNCYIIYNNVVTSISITENYEPLNITMKTPNRIKFNFGYFMPVFYDVIDFYTNDYDFADAADISLLMANTKIKSVRRLNSYSENKVFDATSEFSVYKNYFLDYNRSVFSANWDNKFYRKYSSNDVYSLKSGYFPGIEDKSFFGSKCLVVKDEHITIDDFSSPRINPKVEYLNSSYNVYAENRKQCRVTINITQSIYSLFDNNETFKNNWVNSDGWADADTSRANYIQNTISNIFNTQRKREVVLYGYKNSTESMDVQFESDPNGYKTWSVIEDFDIETKIENNDMILVITISMERGLTVHPQLKIYRY